MQVRLKSHWRVPLTCAASRGLFLAGSFGSKQPTEATVLAGMSVYQAVVARPARVGHC